MKKQLLLESLNKYVEYNKKYEGDIFYLEFAEHLKNDLEKICKHIHEHCFSYDKIIFPGKMKGILNSYIKFCYNSNMKFNPYSYNIELVDKNEQNKRTKEYIHFDFSIKRIKLGF